MRKLQPNALGKLKQQLNQVQRLRRFGGPAFADAGVRGHLFGLLMNELNLCREVAGENHLSTKIRAKMDWETLLYEVELFLKRQANL